MLLTSTINQNYAGKHFPNTKVKFANKKVFTNTANNVEGVFADFSYYSVFSLVLPKDLFQASDKDQFNYCLKALKVFYTNNTAKLEQKLKAQHYLLIDYKINSFKGVFLNTNEILEKQISDIVSPKSAQKGRFYGYTWHHTEHLGEMQLIPDYIHNLVKHTGGREIWGGGKDCR